MPVSQDRTSDIRESREDYRAFLLRCWQEPGAGPEGHPAWRFTLVEAGDEAGKRGFVNLKELVGYLRKELKDVGENVGTS